MNHALKILSIISVLGMLSSCATKALWKATSPESYVRVQSDVLAEEDIQKQGLKYFKSDIEQAYYVEKDGLYKLGDYALRLFGTPVTVAFDAVTSILVIGILVAASVVHTTVAEQCDTDPVCWQHKQKGSYSK